MERVNRITTYFVRKLGTFYGIKLGSPFFPTFSDFWWVLFKSENNVWWILAMIPFLDFICTEAAIINCFGSSLLIRYFGLLWKHSGIFFRKESIKIKLFLNHGKPMLSNYQIWNSIPELEIWQPTLQKLNGMRGPWPAFWQAQFAEVSSAFNAIKLSIKEANNVRCSLMRL